MKQVLLGRHVKISILPVALTMLLLCGCTKAAETEKVPAVQVEAIAEDDPAYVAPEDVILSENLTKEEQQEAAAELAGEAQADLSVLNLQSDDSFASEYLAGLSAEQIDALYAEVLGEKGLNTQVAEGKVKTSGMEFYLPDGFFEDENVSGLYHTKRYPIDASNIYYFILDRDLSFPMLDQNTLSVMLSTMLSDEFGKDIAVEMKEYNTFELDGAPALRAKCEYTIDDQQLSQLVIAVGADQTYFVFYTMTQDYDRSEIFEESAATITLKAGGKGGIPIPEEEETEEGEGSKDGDKSDDKTAGSKEKK